MASRADAVSRGRAPRRRYPTPAAAAAAPSPPSIDSPSLGVGPLVALAVVQLVWLGWILAEPLPNAANGGGVITRSYLLWRFLPEVVPGVTYEQTFLANMIEQLRHVENLPQRLPIVAGAGLILASLLAIGRLATRVLGLRKLLEPVEGLCLAFGFGAALIGGATLFLGRFGLLTPWSTRLALAAPIVLEAILAIRSMRSEISAPGDEKRVGFPPPSLMLAVAPFVLIMALGAMLPTIDFDSIEYHLQGPKEYFLAGAITFLPHNVYTSMPFSTEMLHLLGMHVANDWWLGALIGQLLVASFAWAAGLTIWATAMRWGSPRAAWIATIAYLSTPWIYRMAAIPYVEGPLCFYHAALLWAAARAWTAPKEARSRFWLAAGLLAGGAMATKYPGLVSAVVPFGAAAVAAAWRARSPRIVVAYGFGVVLVMTPWLVKNVVDTGNPVYPLGYEVFGARHWDAEMDAKWRRAHGPRPIELSALGGSLLEVAGRSDWQSPLYTTLAIPALIVLVRSRGRGLLALGFVGYIFATWWLFTHRLDRFWLPLVPALALFAGQGAEVFRGRAATAWLAFVVGLCVVTNFIYCSTSLAGLEDWTGDLKRLRRGVPEMLNPPLARLDAGLAPGAKPLLVGQAAVFHLEHPCVYNTVFDDEILEQLTSGRSVDEIRRTFRERGITHVYVDWHEIERYRSPGNYGYTDYVVPARFDEWVAAGLLGPPLPLGTRQILYEVRD
ncbi:MAG: glycosyltransferase family 39 protein [Isosphaeraceae bacterium]|nr:glycosyltransferase family 39 protein [Isosphaeraceae bacterium]